MQPRCGEGTREGPPGQESCTLPVPQETAGHISGRGALTCPGIQLPGRVRTNTGTCTRGGRGSGQLGGRPVPVQSRGGESVWHGRTVTEQRVNGLQGQSVGRSWQFGIKWKIQFSKDSEHFTHQVFSMGCQCVLPKDTCGGLRSWRKGRAGDRHHSRLRGLLRGHRGRRRPHVACLCSGRPCFSQMKVPEISGIFKNQAIQRSATGLSPTEHCG